MAHWKSIKILKQYDIGIWFGGLKNAQSRAMGYQGVTSVFVTTLTAYNTLILRPEWAWLTVWLEYWMVIMAMGMIHGGFMLFAHTVDTPSSMGFGQDQAWKAPVNPTRDHILSIEEDIKWIRERLEKQN